MTDKVKKLVLLNLPYLIFVYLFDKLCQGVRLAPGADASEKLLHIGQGFSAAFASLAPSFHLLDLCVGAAGAVLIRQFWWRYSVWRFIRALSLRREVCLARCSMAIPNGCAGWMYINTVR